MSRHVAALTLIGRVLLAVIFLMPGINTIADSQGTQQYMTAMGMTWLTGLFYVGAILLIGCMIPATLIFYANSAIPIR
jgi:uncharacterized membrane protein YphA (DoxX/SURF4 family)